MTVKESRGDDNEVVMQLGIWSAAGLEKARRLGGRVIDGAATKPFIGWTVEVALHIAWKESSGRVVSYMSWL